MVEDPDCDLQKELDQYMFTTRVRAHAHRICAERLMRSGVFLHLPVIILNVISAVLSYFLERAASDVRFVIMAITTSTAIIAAIDNYFELIPKATKHNTACRQYESLTLRLASYKTIRDQTNLEKKCNKALELIEQLVTNADVPVIPVHIEARAAAMLREQVRRLSHSRRGGGDGDGLGQLPTLQTLTPPKVPSQRSPSRNSSALISAVVGILPTTKTTLNVLQESGHVAAPSTHLSIDR